MLPETTPPEPETGTDTTDADAEAFADEWMIYKQKVDFIHGILTTEPDKPHWYFRNLLPKKKSK